MKMLATIALLFAGTIHAGEPRQVPVMYAPCQGPACQAPQVQLPTPWPQVRAYQGQCVNGSCTIPQTQGVVVTTTATVPVNDVTAQVNALRGSLGLRPVADCPLLQAAAQRHAERQAAAMAMHHSSMPNENVAQAYPGMACVPLWRQSPGHYRNMTNPSHARTGYGEAVGRDGRLYATQLFADGSSVTQSAQVSSIPLQLTPVQSSPCANGQCPAPQATVTRWRR
jgi:uncharacterized protein YkwD